MAQPFSLYSTAPLLFASDINIFSVEFIELCHVLIGGIGLYALCRSYKISRFGSFLGATIFMFGGSASARLGHTDDIAAYTLMPWVLFFVRACVQTERVWFALAAGLSLGTIIQTGCQPAYLFLLSLPFFVGIQLRPANIRFPSIIFVRQTAITVLTAALTAAPQILATLLFVLPFSTRKQIPLATALMHSLPPMSFCTMLVPKYMGAMGGKDYFSTATDPTETYLYIGLFPIILIVRAVASADRQQLKRFGIFFPLLFVFSLLYALPAMTPFYSVLYHVLPLMTSFKRPSDAMFLFNFSLAVIAAISLDINYDLERQGRRARIRRQLAQANKTTLIALLAMFAWLAIHAYFTLQDWSLNVVRVIARALFAGLYLILGRSLCPNPPSLRARTGLIILLMMQTADLWRANALIYFTNQPPSQFPYFLPSSQSPLLERLKYECGKDDNFWRVDFLDSSAMWGNLLLFLELQGLTGESPYVLRRVHDYLGVSYTPHLRTFNGLVNSFDSPLYNLLGAKYILVLNQGKEESFSAPQSANWKLLFQNEEGLLMQNTAVLRRAFLINQISIAHDRYASARMLQQSDFDPYKSAVLEIPGKPNSDVTLQDLRTAGSNIATINSRISPWDPRSLGSVKIFQYSQNEVKIKAMVNQLSVLILTDLYYPGWNVYIDEKKASMVRADYLFRGVPLKPGNHTVVFRFEPLTSHWISNLIFHATDYE